MSPQNKKRLIRLCLEAKQLRQAVDSTAGIKIGKAADLLSQALLEIDPQCWLYIANKPTPR